MPLVWKEAVDSTEPGQASFTLDGGGKQATYWLTPSGPQDCLDAIVEILGTTSVEVGSGKLQRTLPKSHPQYPWLYASAINSIKGHGISPQDLDADLQDANTDLECEPITDRYVLYREYAYQITFTPRPFALVGDDEISFYDGSWYNYDGVLEEFQFVDEWTRYTVFTETPTMDFVTATQGQMTFRTQTGGTVAPNGTAYAASPRMYLPNKTLKCMWMGVPYRYVTSINSFLAQALGTINQNEWNGYPAGTLLFMGVTPTPYTPVVPELVPWATTEGTTVQSTERLANLELTWLYTTRGDRSYDLPTVAPGGNRNHIVAGHNLMPFLVNRRFLYSASTGQVGGTPADTPSWLSYPHERLFGDPDAEVQEV